MGELRQPNNEKQTNFGHEMVKITSYSYRTLFVYDILLKHIEIKLILSPIGFEKIIISGEHLELFFDMTNENIFSSGYFEKSLGFINDHFKNTSRVKQSKNSLSVQFRIPKLPTPAQKLEEILNFSIKLANI